LNQHPCTRSSSCCPRCLQSPALWTQYPLGCSSASQLLCVQYYVTCATCHFSAAFSQSAEARSSDITSQKARIGPRHCQLIQAHLHFIIYFQTRRTSCRQALHEPYQPTASKGTCTSNHPDIGEDRSVPRTHRLRLRIFASIPATRVRHAAQLRVARSLCDNDRLVV